MFSTSLSRYDIAVGLPPVQSFRRRTTTGKHQNPTPPDPMPRPLSALTTPASHPGRRAGTQAALKTFAANGVHGAGAIAALTAQHPRGVVGGHGPAGGLLGATAALAVSR